MTALKTCTKCGPKSTTEFHKDSSRPDGLYPVCKACRKPLTTAQYASNIQDNVIPCCKNCNSKKKYRPVFVMAKFIKSTIPDIALAA